MNVAIEHCKAASAEECCARCGATANCDVFAFEIADNKCVLKTAAALKSPQSAAGYVGGHCIAPARVGGQVGM